MTNCIKTTGNTVQKSSGTPTFVVALKATFEHVVGGTWATRILKRVVAVSKHALDPTCRGLFLTYSQTGFTTHFPRASRFVYSPSHLQALPLKQANFTVQLKQHCTNLPIRTWRFCMQCPSTQTGWFWTPARVGLSPSSRLNEWYLCTHSQSHGQDCNPDRQPKMVTPYSAFPALPPSAGGVWKRRNFQNVWLEIFK